MALLCVHSSFAIILVGKSVGCSACFSFFLMSRDCCVALTMPGICLQFVIVVFSEHTHLLFLVAYCNRLDDILALGGLTRDRNPSSHK